MKKNSLSAILFICILMITTVKVYASDSNISSDIGTSSQVNQGISSSQVNQGTSSQQADYSSYPDPATAKIATMTGSLDKDFILDKYPDAKISTYESKNDAVLAVVVGKADYAGGAKSFFVNYMMHNPGEIVIVPSDIKSENEAIVVGKEDTDLLEDINTVLDKFRKDGTLDRIISNWIREDGSAYIQDDIPVRQDGEILKVAVAAEEEPMCFVDDGKIKGLDPELIQRIAYELGMRVEFENVKFGELIASVKSGKTKVAISDITVTEERKKSVNFSDIYYDNHLVLAAKSKDSASKLSNESILKKATDSFHNTFIIDNRWQLILSGIGCTIVISVLSGFIGYFLGLLLCFIRMDRHKILRGIAIGLTRFFQGTPIVVILMIFYYIIFNKTGLDGISVSAIVFSLNFAAYASEIMLSGIKAVDSGQREAALAIGFTPMECFRQIVFPQAAQNFLPVLRGELITLIKATSVVGYIAVQDLTKVSDIIRSRTYEAFFPLIITAMIYFALSYGIASLMTIIQRKIDPKHRRKKLI